MKSQVSPIARNRATKGRVFVGMSGGVDSSVSAALLQKAGYDVVGVFIKTWQPDWLPCTWREERRDAMRAAAHLGIPFRTLDLEQEYKRGVADYMISEYKRGRTPNPDVVCNKEVKFGAFYSWAMNEGADFVATGHYAQILPSQTGALTLRTGTDKAKDQSYFLWMIGIEQLKHILFPIGHMEKGHVRALASRFGLPNAEKKDSQGICFLGDVDMKDFLTRYIEQKKGDVLDQSGKVIGSHDGAAFLTIGERHGFSISDKKPDQPALYVVSKDMTRNTVTVAPRGALGAPKGDTRNQIHLRDTNWLTDAPLMGDIVEIRCRYRQQLREGIVLSIDQQSMSAVIEYDVTEDMVAPGQSLVIYRGDTCLGGGIIADI